MKKLLYREVETASRYHRHCLDLERQAVSNAAGTEAFRACGDALAAVVPGDLVVAAGRLYESPIDRGSIYPQPLRHLPRGPAKPGHRGGGGRSLPLRLFVRPRERTPRGFFGGAKPGLGGVSLDFYAP